MRATTSTISGARRQRIKGAGGVRLSMYTTPPDVELSLDEFENFAIDRLIGTLARESSLQRHFRGLKLLTIASCSSFAVLRGIESLRIQNASMIDEKER